MIKRSRFALLFLAGTLLGGAVARAEKSIPGLSGPVIDESGLLTTGERNALAGELQGYLPKLQLQVWIFSSLDGEDIASVGIRAAEAWKLGSEKEDRGAILLLAVDDHRSRIEVGQGLEGDITDLQSSRVLDRVLAPYMRQGRPYMAVRESARALYQMAGGTVVGDADSNANDSPGNKLVRGFSFFGFLLLFGFVMFLRMLSPFGLGRRGPRGPWGGGGWGGGSGGGGGWSGGGGGFSGGGSSGSW